VDNPVVTTERRIGSGHERFLGRFPSRFLNVEGNAAC